jgi:hypothetical protein
MNPLETEDRSIIIVGEEVERVRDGEIIFPGECGSTVLRVRATRQSIMISSILFYSLESVYLLSSI